MLLCMLLLWLLMCLVDWYSGAVRKCLHKIWKRVRILVARQVRRRPTRCCNTGLELFLLRSLGVTLSFWFVI